MAKDDTIGRKYQSSNPRFKKKKKKKEKQSKIRQ